MPRVRRRSVEEILGTEFWTQPEGTLDHIFELIYTSVLEVLRREANERNSPAVDYMLIERVAFQYAWLRYREASFDEAMTDRTRREVNKDLTEVLLTLRKIWAVEDKENMSEKLLGKVNNAIRDAVKDMPEKDSNFIMSRLSESFELHKV